MIGAALNVKDVEWPGKQCSHRVLLPNSVQRHVQVILTMGGEERKVTRIEEKIKLCGKVELAPGYIMRPFHHPGIANLHRFSAVKDGLELGLERLEIIFLLADLLFHRFLTDDHRFMTFIQRLPLLQFPRQTGLK